MIFATSNEHKFKEVSEIGMRFGISIGWYRFTSRELRSDDITEVAIDSVRRAFAVVRKPVFVEDTGLFIDALSGFPGTYSGWVYKKIGTNGILKLLEGCGNRRAVFRTAVAYLEHAEDTPMVFTGECYGSISDEERGNSGFAYDKIFIPSGYNYTFAERIELKNKLSHRYKAFDRFFSYIARCNVHGFIGKGD